jgi:hypothetical protein
MGYLNAKQRDELRDDLKKLKYLQARGKVRGMDPKPRLAYLRNAQLTGRLMTRYDLPSLGTRITLVEQVDPKDTANGRLKAEYALVDVVVEALPGNTT